MSKKIYISPSNQNSNLYASGNTNEMVQCNRIAEVVEYHLNRLGFDAKKAPEGQDMWVSINESNAWGADLHIPIHTNAFNGSLTGGTLIMLYSVSGENLKAGQAIFNQLAPITPGSDYSIRSNTGLAELNSTKAIAVYVECEFHDTAEGADTKASGAKSHAEGEFTRAEGAQSHSEGYRTVAKGACCHVQGRCNTIDNNSKYLHIVGNGVSDSNRKNCHTIDWQGNTWYSGKVYLGGRGQDDTEAYIASVPKYGQADTDIVLMVKNGALTWVPKNEFISEIMSKMNN